MCAVRHILYMYSYQTMHLPPPPPHRTVEQKPVNVYTLCQRLRDILSMSARHVNARTSCQRLRIEARFCSGVSGVHVYRKRFSPYACPQNWKQVHAYRKLNGVE